MGWVVNYVLISPIVHAIVHPPVFVIAPPNVERGFRMSNKNCRPILRSRLNWLPFPVFWNISDISHSIIFPLLIVLVRALHLLPRC